MDGVSVSHSLSRELPLHDEFVPSKQYPKTTVMCYFLDFSENIKYVCIFHPQHSDGKVGWNPFSLNTRVWLNCIVNAMAYDGLVTQGTGGPSQ